MICSRCGVSMPDGTDLCTSCATPVSNTRPMETAALNTRDSIASADGTDAKAESRLSQQGAALRRSGYGRQPHLYSSAQADYGRPSQEAAAVPAPAKVLGTGGYLGALILMGLPLIGLIITIIWACGGSGIQSKVKLARGYLLYILILTVLFILIFGVLVVMYADTLSWYLNMITNII